jgi:hypothetical protein
LQKPPFVIPSKNGIQAFQGFLDPGSRFSSAQVYPGEGRGWGDGLGMFCKTLSRHPINFIIFLADFSTMSLGDLQNSLGDKTYFLSFSL